jgi:SAM-dependent methyltransferase
MNETRRYTEQNRRAWDEIANIRQAKWEHAAFFRAGNSILDPRVTAAAGDVKGLSLLHLQCSTGEETLSWSVLGAVATGVDISPRQIDLAQRKAIEAGLDVHFFAADVYDLTPDLQRGTFDIVYTGGGALVWLPDIARWADAVTHALKRQGRLILLDEHPVASCLCISDGQLQTTGDYFGRSKPEAGRGWHHFAGGENARETKYEFSWPLGDIVTALAQAGLRIQSLQEYPSTASWRFGNDLNRVGMLPGEFLLIATRPPEPNAPEK